MFMIKQLIITKRNSRSCLVLRAPICQVIGVRSRAYLNAGIWFPLFVIGYLELDTHVISTSVTHALRWPNTVSKCLCLIHHNF